MTCRPNPSQTIIAQENSLQLPDGYNIGSNNAQGAGKTAICLHVPNDVGIRMYSIGTGGVPGRGWFLVGYLGNFLLLEKRMGVVKRRAVARARLDVEVGQPAIALTLQEAA